MKRLLMAILLPSVFLFANCAWSESKDLESFIQGLTTEQINHFRESGRHKYTAYLLASVKGMPDYRDKFLMPDQLQALVAEIKLQSSYLAKDIEQNQKSEGAKAALKNLQSDQYEHVLQQLADSPYNLGDTAFIIHLISPMEGMAKDCGDSYLANRFSTIKDKLERHFDALCLLTDMNLDYFAASVFPNTDQAQGSQKP